MASSKEIRTMLEGQGLPQHDGTPLELSCAFCSEDDRLDLSEKPTGPATYYGQPKDGPRLEDVQNWLNWHRKCEDNWRKERVPGWKE